MQTSLYTKQGGFIALFTVLVVGAVGLSIAVAVVLLGLGSSKSSLTLVQSGSARANADTCAEEALQKINENTAFSGTSTLTLSSGTCTYTVTVGVGENRTVDTSGTVGTVVRKIQILVTQITPEINFISWLEIP